MTRYRSQPPKLSFELGFHFFSMVCLACLCLIAGMTRAHAALWIVDVGGSGIVFQPNLLTITEGDNVVFVNAGGLHNVVADDNLFRCAQGCDRDGHGGSGAPSNATWVANVTFTNPGTVGYYCETHGAPNVGMFGTIIVLPAGGPPPVTDTASVPALNGAFGIALALALVLAAALVRGRHRNARNGRGVSRNQPIKPR